MKTPDGLENVGRSPSVPPPLPPPGSKSCSCPYIALGCQGAMSIWHGVCHRDQAVGYVTVNLESLQAVKTEKRKFFNNVYGRNRLKHPL